MKKTLLSTAALMLAAMPAMADVLTLTFDGEGDAYGITRQTVDSKNAAAAEFSPEIAFSEDGIDFLAKKGTDTGNGFALVDAGGTNKGLMIYSGMAAASHITPEISLTSPGGTISNVVLCMTGAALMALDIDCNGSSASSEVENGLYYWKWSLKEAAETATISWSNVYNTRYIHSIEVTYTRDLGGKQACGLGFMKTEVEAFMGEDFSTPTLSNPNRLAVSWSSSNPDVATVDANGKLTLLAGGTTVITAATEGNDKFAAGNAKYTLTVIPVATNIPQMLEYAPGNYDKVKVDCPLTVNFGYSSFAFVTDEEGNAACIEDIKNQGSTSTTVTTLYSKGDVIPAGWVATDNSMNGSVTWQGLPAKVTETVNVEYPVVTSVTPADANRVVVLESVKFETATATGYTKAYGTTPDGTRYEFQDNYDTTPVGPGKYNVTCVVRYSKNGSTEYFYLAPLAYSDATLTDVDAIGTASDEVRWFNLQGVEVANPGHGIFIKRQDGTSSKVVK